MLAGVALWKNLSNLSRNLQDSQIFRWQRLLLKMTVESFGIFSVTPLKIDFHVFKEFTLDRIKLAFYTLKAPLGMETNELGGV